MKLKIKPLNITFILLLLCFIINGCTEPYILETNTYEEALVIEATITNEFKKQEIILTKTSRFEDTQPKAETGAQVYITDNTGNRYEFEEQSGKYISKSEFKAIPEREYHLDIITSDGQNYRSSTEILTPEVSIEDVKPIVETRDTLKGVQIYVSSYDPSNTAKFYRYTYEETYKIIAPKWVPQELIVTGPQSIALIDRTTEAKTCYGTRKSSEIMLANTTGLSESRVNFPIRYIDNKDYIIANRYSILVRLYTQNLESYTYHKTLKEMSGTSGVLSPKQPGLVNGNIKCISSSNKKAIGYFEVAAVSSKRIFFNFDDIFLGDPYPPYYCRCDRPPPPDICAPFCFKGPNCDGQAILLSLNGHDMVFYDLLFGNCYVLLPIACGDCTVLGSNIKPSFWED